MKLAVRVLAALENEFFMVAEYFQLQEPVIRYGSVADARRRTSWRDASGMASDVTFMRAIEEAPSADSAGVVSRVLAFCERLENVA